MRLEGTESGNPVVWTFCVRRILKAVCLYDSRKDTINPIYLYERFFTGIACETSLKPRYPHFLTYALYITPAFPGFPDLQGQVYQ